MIPNELEAKILRLYHAEKWPVGTIASQLQVHHDAVERVLNQEGLPRVKQVRSSIVDPFVPFILESWKKYPRLPASRLYTMCKERGYQGRPDYFRQRVARYRPRPLGEAYLRLRTLAGEQAQVDWGHFGKIQIGRASRALMAFVMVLSWCRAIYLRFFLGQQTENFLRGHELAFRFFTGTSRIVLYDNLKSAVLERRGDSIRFNPVLLDFSGHYHYEARPVAVYRGNEKGRVERAIRYVRSSFFMARKWKDLTDLNRQAEDWCRGEALDRPWPEDRVLTVRDALEQERGKLLDLPDTLFPTEERREAMVGKTPYVRFDMNDYSIPHDFARRQVVVLASLDSVRILSGREQIACHPRSFDKGLQIENPAHVKGLVAAKRAARKERSMDRLRRAVPETEALLDSLAKRGQSLGHAVQKLMKLLDSYGAERLAKAVTSALEQQTPHVPAVRQILEQERHQEGKPPVLPLTLSGDPRVQQLEVRPHSLDQYDAINDASPIDKDAGAESKGKEGDHDCDQA